MTIAIEVARLGSGDDPRADACETIDRESFARPQLDARAELARDFSRLYLALADGVPGAYVLAWLVGGELEIHDVATRPGARRLGLARALVARALADARAEGAEAAFLEVRASNEPALALYRALGFEDVDRRARYYEDGEDARVLRCRLG